MRKQKMITYMSRKFPIKNSIIKDKKDAIATSIISDGKWERGLT